MANRLGQQARQSDVGNHVARRGVAAHVQHQKHQDAHGHVNHQLQHRRVDGPGTGHAQLFVGVALAGLQEALLLVLLAAEAAHHAVTLDGFGRHVRHVAHRHLNLLALFAEFFTGRADHDRDQRQDGDHHQRQSPVHPQQRRKQEHHGHAFTDDDLDRIGGRTGDHGHVEGDARDQVPRVVFVEVPLRQHQQVVEQLDPQIVDQAQRNLGQEVVTQERAKTLPRRDQDDQQRNRLQQAQVSQVGNRGEQHRIRIGQAIHEVLEDVAQHRLGGSKDKEADDAQQKQTDIRPDITEEAQIDLQARFA